jgi:hypothetical protein
MSRSTTEGQWEPARVNFSLDVWRRWAHMDRLARLSRVPGMQRGRARFAEQRVEPESAVAVEDELLQMELLEKDIRANLKLLSEVGGDRAIHHIRTMLDLRADLTPVLREFAFAVIARIEARQRKRELEKADPFQFPLQRFSELTDDERVLLIRRARAAASDRIRTELEERGAAWIVLVGNDVVASSKSPWTIPSPEEVLQMGEPKGLVAYLFSGLLIEESKPVTSMWSKTRYYEDKDRDQYPTIPLAVHHLNGTSILLDADLDTGSPVTFIDADLIGVVGQKSWHSDIHLQQNYEWVPMLVSVSIETSAGVSNTKPVRALVVRNWKASSFVKINPARRMLVGRNLLRAFSLQLELRAGRAETESIAMEAPTAS